MIDASQVRRVPFDMNSAGGVPLPLESDDTLTRSAHGYWAAPGSDTVSYPKEGANLFFLLEDESFWFGHRNHSILRLLKRFPPGGTLVDVGGGNGAVAAAVQGAGHSVVLVEPGEDGARNAVSRGVTHVVRATVESAGFRPGTLPAVGLFDVVEHVSEDRVFFETLSRLMVPGGRLYVSVPAYPWLWSSEDRIAGHFRRYTRGSLTRVLGAAGFRVEYTSYLFSALPLPIFLSRTVPSRLGRRAGQQLPDANGHRVSGRRGPFGWLFHRLLSLEQAAIGRAWGIPLGSSVVAVAVNSPGARPIGQPG